MNRHKDLLDTVFLSCLESKNYSADVFSKLHHDQQWSEFSSSSITIVESTAYMLVVFFSRGAALEISEFRADNFCAIDPAMCICLVVSRLYLIHGLTWKSKTTWLLAFSLSLARERLNCWEPSCFYQVQNSVSICLDLACLEKKGSDKLGLCCEKVSVSILDFWGNQSRHSEVFI